MSYVDIALALVGQGEEGRNNGGLFVADLTGRPYRTNRSYGPWCAYFVSHCIRGQFPRFPRVGNAKRLTRYVAKNGEWVIMPRWHRSPKQVCLYLQKGDIICWHRGPGQSWADWWGSGMGHVGIVVEWDSDTDTLKWVDGNVGPFPAKVCVHKSREWRHKLYGVASLGWGRGPLVRGPFVRGSQ